MEVWTIYVCCVVKESKRGFVAVRVIEVIANKM